MKIRPDNQNLDGWCLRLLTVIWLGAFSVFAHAAPGGVEDGLQAWLRAGSGIAASDGGAVLVWADSGPAGNDATHSANNPFGEQPPIYDATNPLANDKATVRFNNENALDLDLTNLQNSDYTIFVVNARDRFGLANFYIAGSDGIQDRNLVLGYETPELLRQSHFNRDLDAIAEDYLGNPIWVLDTFRFSQSEGRDLFQNGKLVGTDSQTTPLTSNTGTTLGHFRAFGDLFWFQGDLAEVIVYDRALSASEQMQVEMALAVRYDLPVEIDEFVPCEDDWRNHGQYVSALARLVGQLVDEGTLTEEESEEIISQGARSDCGT